jgi:hypothetical protein
MSKSNVTPISGPAARPSAPDGYTLLREPPDEPSCMRLIQALHGVCSAAEETAESAAVDQLELATAAGILTEMLQDRMNF